MDMPLRTKCEGEGEDKKFIREAHTIETEANEERNVLCERERERETVVFVRDTFGSALSELLAPCLRICSVTLRPMPKVGTTGTAHGCTHEVRTRYIRSFPEQDRRWGGVSENHRAIESRILGGLHHNIPNLQMEG